MRFSWYWWIRSKPWTISKNILIIAILHWRWSLLDVFWTRFISSPWFFNGIDCDVITLGFFKDTKGLSIYLCDFNDSYYNNLKDNITYHEHFNFLPYLFNFVTFYFEDEPCKKCINPLDKNDLITGISVSYGTIRNNYLSKSQAIVAINALKLLKSAYQN